MFEYIKCPCGFEARTGKAAELFRNHECRKTTNWPTAFALTSLFATIGFLVWVAVS